jgi:hypothetical protein
MEYGWERGWVYACFRPGFFCKNTQGEEQAGRWYFANWHHLPREPLDGDQTVGVSTPQPTKGRPEVDVCGLTKIGNLKERHMVHNLDRFWPLGA